MDRGEEPQTDVDLAWLEVALLDPLDGNINEMGGDDFNLLLESIRDYGFVEAVETVPLTSGRYIVIGGNHRVEAAKKLGITKVPATILRGPQWEDEDVRMFAAARLNNIKGRPSQERFAAVYGRLAPKYGEDSLRQLMAFKMDAWDLLTKNVRDGIKAAGLPKSALDAFDKGKKRARSLDDLSVLLNTIMAKHGTTLPQNFVAFTHGDREVLWTLANDEVYGKIRKVLDQVSGTGMDINDAWTRLLDGWEERLSDGSRIGSARAAAVQGTPRTA
jgi:hypothetical protein